MIPLLLSAALAAAPVSAAPASAGCPSLVTPEALACRAVEAQKSGDPESAAQAFEEAAKAGPDKDPAVARAYAVASVKSVTAAVAAYYLRKHGHNRLWSLPLLVNTTTSLRGVGQNLAVCN